MGVTHLSDILTRFVISRTSSFRVHDDADDDDDDTGDSIEHDTLPFEDKKDLCTLEECEIIG